MNVLGFGGANGDTGPRLARLELLEREAREEIHKLEALRAQIRERDEDRGLLLEAAQKLRPGVDPKEAAETLFELCRGPFELCTFYLALVDYEQDRMTFPFYFEGGKHRNSRPAVYSEHLGLTGRALTNREPLYYLSQETQEAHGVVYSEAERITGLIPQTWYGVPLGCGEGWGEEPFGLVSFQSFQKDAFSETRRALMDALGTALALALVADCGKALLLS